MTRIRRWRPTLGQVLGGALAGTLAVSFVGLVALRYLGPEIGFRQAAVLLAGVITAVTAGLGALLVRLLLRPIHALERYARAREAGEAAQRPAHFGTRELHALAQRTIAMGDALANREATVRTYTDHVTHELKTPVSAIRAAAELLEDGGNLTEADANLLAQIDGARGQLETQLAALRDVARAREVRYLGSTTLAETVAGMPDVPLAQTLVGADQPMPLAKGGLEIVLTQLFGNAVAHGATAIALRLEGPVLHIEDNGSGISPGNADHLFTPFYTTRRDSGGTGMGLAIVDALLATHGASIRHVPCATGACFEIRFEDGSGR